VPYLYLAGQSSKEIARYSLAGAAIGYIASEYSNNKKFYKDFVKFNFFNGVKSYKKHDRVHFCEPSSGVRKRLFKLYKQFDGFSNQQIFANLGLPSKSSVKNSPIEAKWAFLYYKKYGSSQFSSQNTVSDYDILNRRLTEAEKEEFAAMF
jgi:hypothetical protein